MKTAESRRLWKSGAKERLVSVGRISTGLVTVQREVHVDGLQHPGVSPIVAINTSVITLTTSDDDDRNGMF